MPVPGSRYYKPIPPCTFIDFIAAEVFPNIPLMALSVYSEDKLSNFLRKLSSSESNDELAKHNYDILLHTSVALRDPTNISPTHWSDTVHSTYVESTGVA